MDKHKQSNPDFRVTRRREVYPGDMICLKKQYRGLGHPDDFVVGIVISLHGKYHVLFTEKSGACAIEEVRQIEMGLYYQRLNGKIS